MSSFIIMAIEGVLVETDMQTGLPSMQGCLLYRTINQQYAVVLLTQQTREIAVNWLRKEGIQGYASLLSYGDTAQVLDLPAWKAYQVRQFMQASHVAWYMDTDPATIQAVYLEGVATMMVSNPRFTRPEFRPESSHKVRRWDELVTTIEMDRLIRVAKETPP